MQAREVANYREARATMEIVHLSLAFLLLSPVFKLVGFLPTAVGGEA